MGLREWLGPHARAPTRDLQVLSDHVELDPEIAGEIGVGHTVGDFEHPRIVDVAGVVPKLHEIVPMDARDREIALFRFKHGRFEFG
jgi:hypothetical protein